MTWLVVSAFHVSPITFHQSHLTLISLSAFICGSFVVRCLSRRRLCVGGSIPACRAEGFAKDFAFAVFFAFFVLFCGYFGFPPA
jgi:hypothetical protein